MESDGGGGRGGVERVRDGLSVLIAYSPEYEKGINHRDRWNHQWLSSCLGLTVTSLLPVQTLGGEGGGPVGRRAPQPRRR